MDREQHQGLGFSGMTIEKSSSNGTKVKLETVDNVFDAKLDKEAAQKKLEAEMQKRRERIEK